jgi:hypothetical protein
VIVINTGTKRRRWGKMKIKQGIVFAILMERNGGIIHKSPSYILEKLDDVEKAEKPEQLLDSEGQDIFNIWAKDWKVRF